MANFQGNRINPTRFSSGQIKFHIIAFPLSIFMILPVVFLIGNAFKPLGELFKFPPTIFVASKADVFSSIEVPKMIESNS